MGGEELSKRGRGGERGSEGKGTQAMHTECSHRIGVSEEKEVTEKLGEASFPRGQKRKFLACDSRSHGETVPDCGANRVVPTINESQQCNIYLLYIY